MNSNAVLLPTFSTSSGIISSDFGAPVDSVGASALGLDLGLYDLKLEGPC